MSLRLAIALPWLLSGCLLFGQYSNNSQGNEKSSAEGPSTREMDPSEWDGKVGEDGRIPEIGKVIETGEGYLQFMVWENRLRTYFFFFFYVVQEPEVDLVTARLDMRGRDDEFVRLLSEEKYLRGNLFIRPPFIFHTVLRIQYLDKEKEDEVNTFMFSQEYYD